MSDELAKVYVGGTTVESLEEETAHARVYRALSEALRDRDVAHILPTRRKELRDLPPRNFYDVIDRTIQAADGIIIILAPGDGSSPAEAVVAAVRRKPQVIMSLDRTQPSRLLAGLPRVLHVIQGDPDSLAGQARGVVEQLLHAIRTRAPAIPSFTREGLEEQ